MSARGLAIGALVLMAACTEGPGPAAPVDAGAAPVAVVPARKAQAHLEGLKGQVTLGRDGKTASASAQDLYAKDVVETGEDGEAVLVFPGDRRVELGPDGRFELDVDGAGVLLNVVRGLVLTRVPHGGAAGDGGEVDITLTITTPFGITRIGMSEVRHMAWALAKLKMKPV